MLNCQIFFNNNVTSLHGAEIHFYDFEPTLANSDLLTDAVTIDNPIFPSKNNEFIKLIPNVDTKIAQAKRRNTLSGDNYDFTGLGTWNMVWSSDKIKLNLPAKQAIQGEHTATLTWTLSDAP